MSYKTLMVHLDLDVPNDARLAVAGALAERFDASVIGIAAADFQPSTYFYGSFGDTLISQGQEEIKKGLQKLEELFRSALKGRADKLDWRSAIGHPVPFIAAQARAADLVIVNRYTIEGLADLTREVDPADLVMSAGRPLLVVPPDATSINSDTVVIGWKDTREARRAVLDALPLLRASRKAIVVTIEEAANLRPAHEAAADVVAFLQRHGVVAEAAAKPPTDDVAGVLEEVARDHKADIIVVGAYGHNRLTEWALGGVTRDILMKSARAALISH